MLTVSIGVFLFSTLAVLYPYAIYPAFLKWLDSRGCLLDLKKGFRPLTEFPEVAIVVAAFNEEKVVLDKLRNFAELDYPKDRLRLILASDGSSDRTVSIAKAFAETHPQIEVIDFPQRRGKVHVLNEVMATLEEAFVIFSDANVEFKADAVKELLIPFQHPHIGTVCGKLTLLDVQTGSSHAESRYWQLENALKEKEGKVGSALGANGAIFAMRRSLWTSCPTHLLVEDFYVPMKLLCEGWGNYFQTTAQAFEYTPPTLKDEFHRRVRIGAGAYQILFELLPELGKLDLFSCFAYLSHKVMRWLAPCFLILQSLSGLLLGICLFGPIYTFSLAGLASFAICYAARWNFTPAKIRSSFLMIQQFLGMNAALLVGFGRFVRNSQKVTWQRTVR